MILQVPEDGAREKERPLYGSGSGSRGLPRAEAVLEADQIQDLADQMPELLKAAVGYELRFTVGVEVGGAAAPSPETVEKIEGLLAEVSEDLRLQ